MLVEILKRTPPWVFVLFFVLLAIGYFQSKDRAVSRVKVSLLPIAMIGLSFYGVVSALAFSPVSLFCWLLGIGVATWFGVILSIPRGVSYSIEAKLFSVPGSWVPLALMMAIFFTKYVVAVVLARQLPFAGEVTFMGSISLCYGLFSGLFLARALVIRRAARPVVNAMPSSRT